MTETVMPHIKTAGSAVQSRARAIRRFAAGDKFFRLLTQSLPRSPCC